jgi:hypothetical protein
MANAANPLLPTDGQITISDGAALTLVLLYEDGDTSIGGLNSSQKTRQAFKSRGKTYAVRDVEDKDISINWTAHAVHIIGDGATGTIGDAILKKAVWAAATSKLAVANGDAYLLQVSWRGERTNFGAAADNVITLKYCDLEMDFSEGVPGKLSIKGIAYPISTDYLVVT